MPTISLIISTYNWASALHLVLDSARRQTILPDEIIIADDGSGAETSELIRGGQQDFPVPLIHAWQPDEGFRLARSRNNAVSQSSGQYLIFIDGDTILHPHFVADHQRFAKAGYFSTGSRVLLHETTTVLSLREAQFSFSLLGSEADNKECGVYSRFLSNRFSKSLRIPIEKSMFKIRGCNMAVWRSDYEAINGFNHDFQGWGREDSEFALRLFKKGLSMRRLKFCAIQYHLHHHENDRTQLNANDNLLAEALTADSFRCHNGLDKLLEEK